MLHSLTSLFGRRRDTTQLALELGEASRPAPPPADGDDLLATLRAFGLRRIERCRLTRNRNVMVSYRGHDLRVHEGYLAAPPEVHRAIVRFVEGRTRAERRLAQREIVSFAIAVAPREPRRRERTRAEDEPLSAQLTEWHARLNAKHFGGALRAVPVRVSRRMKSRLGHYSAASASQPGEIAISWRHLRRHGWAEAVHTLLHEMVHQWQDETGRAIDHGTAFRDKARQVGIEPAARRAPARRGA